MIIGEMTKCDR